MELWRNNILIRVGFTALVAMLLVGMHNFPVSSRSAICLAEDYPYAAVFLQMVRRGLADYSARYGEFPQTISGLSQSGYMAYDLPSTTELNYANDQTIATFDAFGHDSYWHGHQFPAGEYQVKIPKPGYFHLADLPGPIAGDPDNQALYQVPVWHFEGAEWLELGYGWNEVEPALRFHRIATHLIWAADEYGAVIYNMPSSLEELEAYIGVTRNQASWEGVNIVSDLSQVEYAAGNLFAGWDGKAWVISCNLGPEIETERFIQTPSGDWNFSTRTVLVY